MLRNHKYTVNTFKNGEPVQVSDNIECHDIRHATEILIRNDIISSKGYEFLVFEEYQLDFLWRFFWDCGRWGCLEGLFVATNEEVENIIGKEVAFGEVLGKHSDIFGDIVATDIIKIEAEEDFIEEGLSIFGRTWSGYNPIEL